MKPDTSGVEFERMLTEINALRLMFVFQVKGQCVSNLTVSPAVKSKQIHCFKQDVIVQFDTFPEALVTSGVDTSGCDVH